MRRILLTFLLGLFYLFTYAQAGANDPTFNPGTGANFRVFTTALQPNGKIIIGGDFTTYNGTGRNRIARLNADGTLDATFNPGTGANGLVRTTALQPDGKIIIGGDFTTYNGIGRSRIARLNADGTLDATFDPGTGANAPVLTIALQPDGNIIIGGHFSNYDGIGINYIARLDTYGYLDFFFNPGTGANSSVWTTALQPDGKIIIGGQFTTYNGTGRIHIARLNADGTLDATFNPGTGANDVIWTTTLQPDGKIIIGVEEAGAPDRAIIRMNTNGMLDATFYCELRIWLPVSSSVNTIALQPDGKIIIGGWFSSCNGTNMNAIARVNANGTLDATFNPGTGVNTLGEINTIALQPDGKIIIGGQFPTYNGTVRSCIARILVDESLPIELLSFDAKRQSIDKVQLYWATASETNNQGFDIERMLEGETEFTKVVWVDGNGTTTNTSYYNLVDDNGYDGVSYYRLKQIDFDGSFAYSDVKAVSGWKTSGNSIDVFPNPIHNNIHIRISSESKEISLQLLDSKGALVLNKTIAVPTDKLITLEDLGQLADGLYLLSIKTDNGELITKKIVK